MIHEPSVGRIKDNECGSGLLDIFNSLTAEAEESGEELVSMMVDFIEAEDDFVEGTYVPELWFLVRKVT